MPSLSGYVLQNVHQIDNEVFVDDVKYVLFIILEYSCFRQLKKVQVRKDQEKAQSEKDSHSKNQGGKKKNKTNNQALIP